MTTTELLAGLNRLEDQLPTILDQRHNGVLLHLSPDGSGSLVAQLIANGKPSAAFLKQKSSPDSYVALATFDALPELEKMLESPDAIAWKPR